jgi:hypothetical protein
MKKIIPFIFAFLLIHCLAYAENTPPIAYICSDSCNSIILSTGLATKEDKEYKNINGLSISIIYDNWELWRDFNLDASASNDPNGYITSYSWTLISIITPDGFVPIEDYTPFSYGVNTTYVIEGDYGKYYDIVTYIILLKIIDNGGLEDTDQIRLQVQNQNPIDPPNPINPIISNIPPVTITGDDITLYSDEIQEDTEIIFDAGSSYDPDGHIIYYSWVQTALETAYGISPHPMTIRDALELIKIGIFCYEITQTINFLDIYDVFFSYLGLEWMNCIYTLTIVDNAGAVSTDEIRIKIINSNPSPQFIPPNPNDNNSGGLCFISSAINTLRKILQ